MRIEIESLENYHYSSLWIFPSTLQEDREIQDKLRHVRDYCGRFERIATGEINHQFLVWSHDEQEIESVKSKIERLLQS